MKTHSDRNMHIPPNFQAQFDERVRPLDPDEVETWNLFVTHLENPNMKPASNSPTTFMLSLATTISTFVTLGFALGFAIHSFFGSTVTLAILILSMCSIAAAFGAHAYLTERTSVR